MPGQTVIFYKDLQKCSIGILSRFTITTSCRWWWSRPRAASAPTTSIPSSSRSGSFSSQVRSLICAQLLFLESENPNKEISFYINSPGGVVSSGLAIYDTMQYIRSPVSTVCIGQAASMGSLLLCAGHKGKRFALPNARVMVHRPSGGAQGQATDIEIQAREILNLRRRLNQIYVDHTGQPLEAIEAKLERDSYMSAEEAKEFGIVDDVVKSQPTLPEAGTDDKATA